MITAVRPLRMGTTTKGALIMKTKLAVPMFAALAVVVASAAGAPALAAGGSAKPPALMIIHQTRGCHNWSLNGAAYKPSQTVKIRRGGSLNITNNDVMPHKLIETSGPAVTITRLSAGTAMGLKGTFPPAMMAHMASAVKLTFSKPGMYKFTTKPGEDYMPGIKTTGADNILTLKVVVS